MACPLHHPARIGDNEQGWIEFTSFLERRRMRSILVVSIAVVSILCCGCPMSGGTNTTRAEARQTCRDVTAFTENQIDLVFQNAEADMSFGLTFAESVSNGQQACDNVCGSDGGCVTKCVTCLRAGISAVYGR